MKTTYVIIDIESISHEKVVGIGLICGDSDGKIILKREWWIEFEEYEVDPRCLTEFWKRYCPDVYKYALNNGKNEKIQIKSFVEEFDSLHKKLGINEWDIQLVSDNPEYDFGRLTPYIKKHCNREPLRYTKSVNVLKYNAKDMSEMSIEGEYRQISDLKHALHHLGVTGIVSEYSSKVQVADHHPMNDAHNIYLQHLMALEIMEYLRNSRSSSGIDYIAKLCCERILRKIKL